MLVELLILWDTVMEPKAVELELGVVEGEEDTDTAPDPVEQALEVVEGEWLADKVEVRETLWLTLGEPETVEHSVAETVLD